MANLKTIIDTAANLYARFPQIFPNTLPVESTVAPLASTITLVEGLHALHRTRITLSAFAVSLSDSNVGGGAAIYTFPEGLIMIEGGFAKGITPTTTSTLTSTLNASKTLSTGIGSVQTTTQASGTLATTEQDIVNQFSTTSSATINVAGTAGNGKCSATQVITDGTSAAKSIYLNFGVPTATDIDGDATITVDGVVEIFWRFIGDY